jgi:rod shape-determining protein MreD
MTPLGERILVIFLALAAIHVPLLPVGHEADRLGAPDLLFCVILAGIVRRPRHLGLPSVLVLGLTADILLDRPPGLGALGLVLAAEAVRASRAVAPLVEWLRAAFLFGAILAAQAALVVLTLGPWPGIEPLLRHWGMTALAYPLVAVALHLMLRPRRMPAP